MSLLSLGPALGAAAIPIMACSAHVSLGDAGVDCPSSSACGLEDSSAADIASVNDSSPPDDAGPMQDSSAVDTEGFADAAQPDSVSPAPEAGLPDGETDSGNTVNGRPDGTRPFGTIASAWWIEKPNPRVAGGPVESTVVYLFSKAVPCDTLTVAKWDEIREPSDTQNLEINVAWGDASTPPTPPPPLVYPVVQFSGGGVPPPGTAGVLYQVTVQQPPGTPSERGAVGGTVTLTALTANVNVTGAIDLTFADGGMLAGRFDALFCSNGREP